MIDRLGRLLLVVAAMAALVLGSAGPASAHATLVGTDPVEGAVLDAAPDRIGFTFSEPVVGVPDGVRVFDAAGTPVASSAAVSGAELAVSLTEEVADGTLVVAWRVVSGDGHPISGSLSFSVGAASAEVAPPPVSTADTTEAPRLLSVVRWIGYVGLFLATGLVAFMVLNLSSSRLGERARRRLLAVARAGAGAAVLAWLAGLPLVAIYLLGGGLDSLTEGSTWTTLAPADYGVTAAVVVGVVVAVVLVGGGTPGRSRGRAALIASVVATCAPALTGHTRAETPEVLVVGADMLHLLAGSVWLGGLVGLALVLSDLAGRDATAGEVLARFSGVAAGVLAALVIAGSVLSWRIVGSWSALFESGYGRLLLVKIAVAALAVAIAAWNRFRLLPLLQRAVRRRERRGAAGLVVRATAAEAALLVLVLLVTGLLVDRSPESDAALAGADSDPGVQTLRLGGIEVEAGVSPLTIGSNTVTIELRDGFGEPTEGFDAPRASFSSDQVDIGTVPVASVAPGVYSADVVLPAPGTWELQVSLRTSEFDNPVASVAFVVAQ